MRRKVVLLGALLAFAFVALTAAGIATAAGSADQAVTVRSVRGGTVDFNFAPPAQQPACLIAIGGFVQFSADTVEHAGRLLGDLINVAGSDRVTITAGDYTGTVTFGYQGQGVPDEFGEVITSSSVDVDLVSSTTGDVVRTTRTFYAGVNVIPGVGLAPFSLALPNYSDVICR